MPPKNKRHVRYHSDTDYRQKVQNSSRAAYRRKAKVELFDTSYSLEFVDQLAQTFTCACYKSTRKVTGPVLTVAQTAEIMQVIYQTFWRWVDRGLLPAPILLRDKHPHEVYHVDEVRVLVEELSEHRKQFAYLRSDHLEVTKRIARRFAEVRKALLKRG